MVEATGEAVGGRLLTARCGWLTALTGRMASGVVAGHWSAADLGLLASGRSVDGRVLPVKGWMALRRLGWTAVPGGGVYVSDRVRRVVEEQAARMLRAAVYRRSVVAAVLGCWPADPGRRTDAEWQALRAVLPAGVTGAEVRNRTRQVHGHLRVHGVLPVDLVEVEGPPPEAPEVLLAAADRQLVTLDRVSDTQAVLRVQLPLTPTPTGRRDWAVHTIPVTLPPNVPAAARLCTPTLRVVGHRVRLDLPFTITVETARAVGHRVAVGVDWGVNTLLTATVGRLNNGRVAADGRMLRYDATVISAKLHRLRRHRETLATKREHYARLAGPACPDRHRQQLRDLHARVDAEHARVCARIRHLNHALAWSAARWTVEQAVAVGASVVYLEDLTTLEARGRRAGNVRLSGQVRGRVAANIRHLAAKAGIAAVTVPARGTSKHCPRCGAGSSVLHHAPAPDRVGERGWKWAVCRRCGLSGDRDWAAAERIVARGLLGQVHTRTDRTTGHRHIQTIVEGNVARARRPQKATRAARRANRTGRDMFVRADRPTKTRSTPNRPSRSKTSTIETSPRAPEWRAAPAPTLVGQRPAGQVPQTCRPAARSGLARDPQHRTGFHRVRATPVIGLNPDYGATADRPHPPGMSDKHRQPQRI